MPPEGEGPRRCKWTGCCVLLPAGARADRDFCKSYHRVLAARAAARAKKAQPIEAEAPTPPPIEELILSGLYDGRQSKSLPPLLVDDQLAIRARWAALDRGLAEVAKEGKRLQLPYGDALIGTYIIPEGRAQRAAELVRALAEPEATHVGFATVPIGGGQVVLSVVVGVPRGARVLTGSGGS